MDCICFSFFFSFRAQRRRRVSSDRDNVQQRNVVVQSASRCQDRRKSRLVSFPGKKAFKSITVFTHCFYNRGLPLCDMGFMSGKVVVCAMFMYITNWFWTEVILNPIKSRQCTDFKVFLYFQGGFCEWKNAVDESKIEQSG